MRVWTCHGNMVCLDGTTAFWVNDDALLGEAYDDDEATNGLAQFIVDACNAAEFENQPMSPEWAAWMERNKPPIDAGSGVTMNIPRFGSLTTKISGFS